MYFSIQPKIPTPPFLQGEELVTESLRVYLFADGRHTSSGLKAKAELLPAEGALFVTNYRIIFKGNPCDADGKIFQVLQSFTFDLTEQSLLIFY